MAATFTRATRFAFTGDSKETSGMRLFVFLVALISVTQAEAEDSDDFAFKIPSAITLSGTSSNAGINSGTFDARVMLQRNFWLGAAFDHAVENTDGFEIKTSGSAFSIGTDPLAEYTIEGGYENSGVTDQYRVQEGRVRLTAMPDRVFSVSNRGVEAAIELRTARFSFANTPNPVFQTTTVELQAQSARFELSYYGWSPWTIRLWTEKTKLAEGFKDLARPLAPLFIPLAAISTAVSWPGEEFGAGLAYSRHRWSTRIFGSYRTAFVSNEQTGTLGLATDFKWTSWISNSLRFSHVTALAQSSSAAASDGQPIQTYGLDTVISF
jgi:hypothetical protein